MSDQKRLPPKITMADSMQVLGHGTNTGEWNHSTDPSQEDTL